MTKQSFYLRQIARRARAADNEVHRLALLSVARNTTLAPQVRHKAQLALNTFDDGQGRLGQVNRICTETGKARGMVSKFGLCRFRFRQNSLRGLIPGMKKASW